MAYNPSHAAALAAHRFGLGEASLQAPGRDAQGWLLSQIGPLPQATGLTGSATAMRRHAEFALAQRQRREAPPPAMAGNMDARPSEQQFGDHFRELVQADLRSHLSLPATSPQPFMERMALFWANHFTVSQAKASVRALVGPFEREAIRPHVAGRFEDMLRAAVTHVAMLRYLDNDASAGPNSRVVRQQAYRSRQPDAPGPRVSGLNENLAREVLELHTLGVNGGYGQADVTALAAVLTGWRPAIRPGQAINLQEGDAVVRFDAAWHEPDEKRLLGRSYPEGEAALNQVLHDLARHPRTAQFVATKLARHVVADDPPAALVARLAQAYTRSDGDLPTLYRALIEAPQSWEPALAKLKTPLEFVVSTARLLGSGAKAFERQAEGGIYAMGQRLHAPPSPAGWPDKAEEWLGPEALWKRVEWANRLAERAGRSVDARSLAQASLGPLMGAETARQIERAADGSQALALLLLSPEFQRR